MHALLISDRRGVPWRAMTGISLRTFLPLFIYTRVQDQILYSMTDHHALSILADFSGGRVLARTIWQRTEVCGTIREIITRFIPNDANPTLLRPY